MSSLVRVPTNLSVAASLAVATCSADVSQASVPVIKESELSRLQQTTLELSKTLEVVKRASSQISDSTATIPTETALKIHDAAQKVYDHKIQLDCVK